MYHSMMKTQAVQITGSPWALTLSWQSWRKQALQ